MIKENFLICLAGLPASGKTSFAESIKGIIENRYKDSRVQIIDPDKIRESLSPDRFDHNKEQLVRKENLKEIRTALENNEIVISDDLNYYTSMRHNLKAITDSLDIRFYIIYISTPIEKCLKWNEKRGFTVPNEVIKEISKRFDNFDKYSWEYPLIKIDMSIIKDVKSEAEEVLNTILKDIESEEKKGEGKSEIFDETRAYKEKLDKVTRNYVSILVQNPEYSSLKEDIIRNRKLFIKTHSNLLNDDSEIAKTFKEHLEKTLDIKIT